MEYNSFSWMGAAQSHLDKLDRVQRSAEKIGCFQVESLQSRREAAVMAMALKMLNGDTRGELKTFTPVLMEPMRLCKKQTRQSLEGIQVVSKVRTKSLDVYKRSFQGILYRKYGLKSQLKSSIEVRKQVGSRSSLLAPTF